MKKPSVILAALMLVMSFAPVLASEAGETPAVLTEAMDYSDPDNWVCFCEGGDEAADVFLICPTVDTRSYANSLDLNEKLKGRFSSEIQYEKGLFTDSCRVYSPYYRQMSINAYSLPEAEAEQALKNAYLDTAAAFSYYLENENGGRPLVLAGFSQGAQLCIELLKEFFSSSLKDRLVAVYAFGWRVTDDDIKAYPQIVPAKGESDLGAVICYECEDGSVTGSIIIPEGVKTHSINPLNWKTDGTKADSSLNKGALLSGASEPIPGFCGAYIDEARGSLVIPDVSTDDYPKVLDIFPEGCLHLYDVMFFYENVRENVSLRVNTFVREKYDAHRSAMIWMISIAAAVFVMCIAGIIYVNVRKRPKAE